VAVSVRSGIAPSPDGGDLLLVAAGDDAALRRLLARWTQPVYGLFERVKEPSAAAEATLQTFERLVRAAGKYNPSEPFPSFLWGHAARVVMDFPSVSPVALSTARLSESAAARTALQRSAVAALSPGERAAFLLTRVARLPLATAAGAQGISELEARRRLVSALEALRGTLRPLLDLGLEIEAGDEGARADAPPAGVTP
jgi:DNA-directed RNA polymerase specialized sigma24 family protein